MMVLMSFQPVDEEQEEAVAEDAANVSISTINEDGTIEEQNSIEDALQGCTGRYSCVNTSNVIA